jgi:hypothetical protein
LTLAKPLSTALGNGTVLGVGSFGTVVMGNSRNLVSTVAHCEQVGACLYSAGAQHVQLNAPNIGINVKRGAVVTDNSSYIKVAYPVYIASNTALTLLEVTSQGTNQRNTLTQPLSSGAGSGPAAFVANAGDSTNAMQDYAGIASTRSVVLGGLATTQTPGAVLANLTAATVGTPVQNSPCERFDGQAWNTTAVASQLSSIFVCNFPTNGSTIDSQFAIYKQNNNGSVTLLAYTNGLNWQSQGNLVAAADVYAGGLAATGSLRGQHIVGGGSAPTIAVGSVAQLGTGPAASIVKGSDSGFVVRITTGTTPTALAGFTPYTFATVTFNSAYGAAPTAITCHPANGNAGSQPAVTLYANEGSTTTTQAVLQAASNTSVTLGASTQYEWACHVLQ